jgi:hypothetical protein
MEQYVGLVVLEHLSYELDVHVLYIDFLQTSVHRHDGFVELLLYLGISTHNDLALLGRRTMFVMIRERRRLCCCS